MLLVDGGREGLGLALWCRVQGPRGEGGRGLAVRSVGQVWASCCRSYRQTNHLVSLQ